MSNEKITLKELREKIKKNKENSIKIDNLEERCNQLSKKGNDFSVVYLGNVYCSLGKDKKIDCPWQSKKRDHNGFYPCNKYIHFKNGFVKAN